VTVLQFMVAGQEAAMGCIVPTDFAIVQQLYKLVKARAIAGKPAPTLALAVVAIGDLDSVDRRLAEIQHTA
jgi:hypothetical protein